MADCERNTAFSIIRNTDAYGSYIKIFTLCTPVTTGTAYRLTKNGGDNGVSLFGWMLVMGLASLIPGLGIYLWVKYKDID